VLINHSLVNTFSTLFFRPFILRFTLYVLLSQVR